MAIKATSFMISVILVGLFAGVFSLFMAEINLEYSPEQFTQSEIDAYNKLDDLQDDAKEMQDASNIEEKSGITDIIGGYFTSAYKAIRIMLQSMGLFNTMTEEAIEQAPLGQSASLFKTAFNSIIIVLVVVGILLAAVVKRDL